MLKSANKTETNIYTLEVTVSGEDFKAAIIKAYNKKKGRPRRRWLLQFSRGRYGVLAM